MYNSNHIYLQKHLKVSNDEISAVLENGNDSRNVISVNVNNIADYVYEDADIYFHEFSHSQYHKQIKLFFDIDFKDTLDNFKDELRDAKKIITKFIVNLKKENNLHSETTIEDLKDLENYIYKNIKVTKSTSISKTSIHIFCNNVYFETECIYMLKNEIKKLKDCENKLLKAIDIAVYKKNCKLRTIYSKKEDSVDVHIPYKKDENILNYFFTHIDINNPYIIFKKHIVPIESISADIERNCGDSHINLKLLKGREIKAIILRFLASPKFQSFPQIDITNYLKIDDRIGFHLGEKIKFRFVNDVCYCSKTHKHDHFIIFNEYTVDIMKEGGASCMKLSIKYPKLSFYDIGKILVDELGILKCTHSNIYMIWDGLKWESLDDKRLLLNTMMRPENLNKLKFHDDKDNIENRLLNQKNMDTVLVVAKKNVVKTNTYPYGFAFKNGVYDFKKRKFIIGEESKKYMYMYNTGYDYKSEEEMNHEEKKEFEKCYEYILGILDDIIPSKIKGKTNIHRINFDKMVSLSMLSIHKGFIIFLVGPTHSGKSTLKSLIKRLLGDQNTIEIGINNYTDESDPEKNPRPGLGSIDCKLCTFASETAFNTVYKAVQFKRLTEPVILARMLHSNKLEQQNLALHFIDSNFKPEFDNLDGATVNRYGTINVDTHRFISEKEADKLDDEESFEKYQLKTRKTKIIDKDLKVKFDNQLIELSLFKYFNNKLSEYHLEGVDIPKFEMDCDINRIQDSVVYSAFVLQNNLKSEFEEIYCKEKLQTQTRFYLTFEKLREIVLEKEIIKNEKVFSQLDKKRKYYYVFKDHINDLSQVKLFREKFKKDKRCRI